MADDGGRGARLGKEIQGELAEMIRREVKDPRVHAAGILTVTRVEVTNDGRYARVFVSFIGEGATEAHAKDAIAGLTRAAGFVRGEIGRRLGLRRAPELKYFHDHGAENAQKIDQLLKE